MNRYTKTLYLAALVASGIRAEMKIINSLQIAFDGIPGARETGAEGERIQKSRMAELKEIETKAQKIVAEIQKERTDLMAKRSLLKSDDLYKEEKKIKDKERQVEEMQANYQRIMHDLETEMQMVQMRLQPFIMEAIQNAQEVASKNPSIEAVWDEATGRIIYKKPTADMNAEVVKLTSKKNEEKTAVAKNGAKPATTKTV